MAGRIPRQFIDELMLRSDIVEVIDARVPLKKAGKDYKACCPFHQEKTPSFTVSADKQFYHCFGCGQHGTVIGFLMEYDRMSFPEAVEELARRAGMEIPKEAGTFEPEPSGDLLELLREASRFYRAQLREHPPAIEYLKQRGITGEVARDFELGYAPESWDSLVRALGKDNNAREAMVRAGLAVKKDGGGYYDRFRARVMFPIYDHRGRIVGFGGRIIDKGEPKYLNSPETPLFHKGRELYGLFRARDAIRRSGRVMVVEGYMDVVAVAQSGIDYVVATLGTATTRDHLERLFRHASEVVFCFDGDRAGREAAWRALETTLDVLRDGWQASFLFLPDGEDPDTLVRKEGREAFEARLGKATALADFMFQGLSAKVKSILAVSTGARVWWN
jgi:DNA primase